MIVSKSLNFKYKKMKKIIFIIATIFVIFSCKAQHIIPVEEAVNYRNTEGGLLGDRDYVYVKDINNLLNKYIGTWKGTYNSKNYEFKITKITDDRVEVKEDLLLMRYKIKDSSNNVIENTLNLSNDSPYIIRGSYLSNRDSYVLNYVGFNDCGQNGTVFITVNGNTMNLFLSVDGEMGLDCTTGGEQILPVNGIELTKQ